MNSKYDGRTVADDMIDGCCDVVDRKTAIKAVRALCRYFGGMLFYIPANKITGGPTKELHGVLCDAIGDHGADLVLGKIMSLFGAQQIYVPMEKAAFKETIAREIYERLGKENIRSLCRDYSMSFSQIYRLWRIGRKNKIQEKRT